MKNRQYQGVQLSKKESELIEWLQKGSHEWYQSFYMYPARNKHYSNGMLKERSWFNRVLKSLHKKNLCLHIPFVHHVGMWRNPGLKSSKANFVALTLQETNLEKNEQAKKILV